MTNEQIIYTFCFSGLVVSVLAIFYYSFKDPK